MITLTLLELQVAGNGYIMQLVADPTIGAISIPLMITSIDMEATSMRKMLTIMRNKQTTFTIKVAIRGIR